MLRVIVAAVWTPDLGSGPWGRGKAFMEIIERHPTDILPAHGGVAATITVT